MTLGLAILGSGEIAATHLQSLKELSDFNISYICDIDEEKANDLAKNSPGSQIEKNMDMMITNKEIDIVDICLPPHLHFSTALKFLKADKHVICEKPLSTSVNEAQKLIDISYSKNKNLYPVFQYRYGKHILILKDLISKGKTGEPIVASSEVHWNRNEEYYNVPWRGNWEREGGGAILSHAIHSHDLLSFFLGKINSVSANLSTLVNQIETEDCASIAMTTESGALITSSITLGAAKNTTRLKLVFEEISVESGNNPYAPGDDEWIYTARDPNKQNELENLVFEAGNKILKDQNGFTSFFQEVANHLMGKNSNIIKPEDGLKSIELVAAIYHSARTECKVYLPLDTNSSICKDWKPKKIKI